MKKHTIVLVGFVSTIALILVLLGAGAPVWGIIVLSAFAVVEASALALTWKDRRLSSRRTD